MESKVKLPKNSVRCSKIEYLHSDTNRLGSPDFAAATIKGEKRLCSWGLNWNRNEVEFYSARKFVARPRSQYFEELY